MTAPTVTLNGTLLDPDTVEYQVTVQHGRSDIFTSPSPSNATVILRGPTSLGLEVGDELRIDTWGVRRFTGNITDLALQHLGDGTPILTVTAIGRLGLLGYRLTDPTTQTAETARQRATRILDDSDLDYLNGATPDLDLLAPTEEIPYSCTDALRNLAEWTGGTFFDTPGGLIVFESYGVRGQTANPGTWAAQTPTWEDAPGAWNSYPADLNAYELDPDAVVYAPTWSKTSTAIVNDVTITYGDPEATDTTTDADSITAYGRRAVEITTGLAALTDAEARAAQILLAQAYPRWNLGQVTVLVHRLANDYRPGALALQSGSPVVVRDLPTYSPVTEFGGLVEGWTETHTPGQHLLTLSLSDRRFSYQTVPWDDVDPALTWADVNASIQWYNVVAAGDLAA